MLSLGLVKFSLKMLHTLLRYLRKTTGGYLRVNFQTAGANTFQAISPGDEPRNFYDRLTH